MESKQTIKPWQLINNLVEAEDTEALNEYIGSLPSSELVHTIFRLSVSEQTRLMCFLSPDKAAEIMEEVPESYAAEVLEEIKPEQAASIITEMQSDEQVNIFQKLGNDDAEQILSYFDDDEAEGIRSLIDYAPDVAAGLMMREFLCYPQNMTVKQVIQDLTERSGDYALYNVQYLYVVKRTSKLIGVLRLRDLVLSEPSKLISELTVPAVTVEAETSLEDLHDFFESNDFSGCPVVDEHNNLLGVLRQKSVDLAIAEKAEADHQKSQGIIGGEELRSMPTLIRSKRRLSWLSINIVLNMIAASVIAMYEETLTAVIALAVFLPIVSDMSGCSGNQSVAVSMRELTLGIAKPVDVFRIWLKEISVGFINGLVLGTLLALAAWLWIGNPYLGLVVGTALALNTLVAVSLGGTVPLILKKFKVDPAIASGPILTTVTDMCGFFFVLGLATLALPLLTT